ncbi:unnamed protein product [Allacma fusca]|uniref:Glucosylceramidase n=1 Tax=Allacma fusca TaxID=39272 RepID=A0A8J2PDY7_9HEXA|nr:unnamed protein product [Allacma fusca]
MKSLGLAVVLVSMLASSTLAGIPCNRRQFNHDSIVCVCDSNSCDTLGPLNRTQEGVVQIFESTRAGKRFEYREQRFNDGVNPPGNQWDMTLDPSWTFQEILGFGGAFSDAATLGMGSLSDKVKMDALRSYYSPDGIEYSLGRVVISGSDFSNRGYSYNDNHPDDWDHVNFAFVGEDIDYKIPQIKLAKEMTSVPIKFFASSWSPPAWMKANGELNHGSTLWDAPGSRTWKSYAKYLSKFFEGYRKEGIEWWGMTVQNEPAIWDPWFPWNTCGMDPAVEREFVKVDLSPELERLGYTPETFKVLVLDHNRNLLPGWTDVSFADNQANRWIAGTGVHWYGNDVSSVTAYDNLHGKYPDKMILATEACHSGPENDRIALGSWTIGEMYAHDIIADITHWVVGWTDWNLALDMQGGPNWANNGQSAPIIVNAAANEFYKNPSYYAMGHFSKFLPPQSKRIRTIPEYVANEKFDAGAFSRPDGGVVVIAINSHDDNQVLNINHPQRGLVKVNVEPHSFNSVLIY